LNIIVPDLTGLLKTKTERHRLAVMAERVKKKSPQLAPRGRRLEDLLVLPPAASGYGDLQHYS
jgi:hypothetical protein